ncbi:MAG: lysostaphin resistance A-like protein [Methanosarcina sp.]
METSESINMKTIEITEGLKTETSENLRGKTPQIKNKWLYVGLPVIAIAFAELWMFQEREILGLQIHAVILLALSLSTLYIKDQEIQRTYQALLLLPILRLINLSMPVFYDTTLYSFIFIYSLAAIPVSIAATNQGFTREQLGITFDKIGIYIPLSIILGLLLGIGEYMIIRTNNLIPDFSVFNLLILSIIMIFFVGLVEETIFRSILQNRLDAILGSNAGLIVTSILFGLMHSVYGNINEIVYTFFVGIFIGYLFYKTRSLPLVMLIHGFINVFLFGVFPFLF